MPDPDCWGSEYASTPCISAAADLLASGWFLFFLLFFPFPALPETGAVVELATGEIGVLGGLDVPPVFSCFWGQEEELCLMILQVRQVFGARGHQARTFVPKTSKMVRGVVVDEGSTL